MADQVVTHYTASAQADYLLAGNADGLKLAAGQGAKDRHQRPACRVTWEDM